MPGFPFPTAFPPSQDGRKRRPEEGKQAGLMLAVSSSPFEQPVRSLCFFSFPSRFSLSLPSSSVRCLSPLRPLRRHHPLHPRKSMSACDCCVCRFSLLNSVIIIRPKQSSYPIYRRTISQIAGRGVGGTEDLHRQRRDRPRHSSLHPQHRRSRASKSCTDDNEN